MEIIYSVTYHEKVISNDIPKLPKTMHLRIKKAIIERLTRDPFKYGKPLRKSPVGYRKLRIGSYRVIFTIKHHTIKIWRIQHRKIVYKSI